MFVLGDRRRFERLIVEVAGQDEGAIVFRFVPGEAEEGVLGLEVADLQGAIDLGVESGPTGRERQFRFGRVPLACG